MTRMAGGGSRHDLLRAAVVALGLASLAIFAEGIGFNRLQDPDVMSFRRQPGGVFPIYDEVVRNLTEGRFNFTGIPFRADGFAGAAILDVDVDGDLDVFLPTGPGAENVLFINTLIPEGTFRLVSTCNGQSCASVYNLAYPELDGNGLCAGDIDNDGDQDLVMLNFNSPVQLLRNDVGTFVEVPISMEPQPVAKGNAPTSCTFGDVDEDGLVDLMVSYGMDTPLRSEQLFMGVMPQSKLLMNKGPGAPFHFVDETNIRGFAGALANLSWSVVFIDYDKDGDVDLFSFDDRVAPIPQITPRGAVHISRNDGSGEFDMLANEETGLTSGGSNMGHAFADFNCDGNLDFFTTRSGALQASYFIRLTNFSREGVLDMVDSEGRMIAFGNGDGTYNMVHPTDPSGKRLQPPFGWGVIASDFDNDGDTDLAYAGGLIMTSAFIVSPGVVLENQGCTGRFTHSTALDNQKFFERSTMSGVAAGDLNDDGYMDFVAISGVVFPDNATLTLLKSVEPQYVLDEVKDSPYLDMLHQYFAFMDPEFNPSWGGPLDDEGNPVFSTDGIVAVEMNDASSGNNFVKVKLRGSVGDIEGAKVNRDGTGAIISFTPSGGQTVAVPQTSGDIHGISDKEKIFGLGAQTEGQLVVMWPGKTYNVLKVFASETVVMPEIPCTVFDFQGDDAQFIQCLANSLASLRDMGIIDNNMHDRLFSSMIEAYNVPNF